MIPVVVLVFAHKARPDERELLSFTQCRRVLGGHPLRLVCPEGLDVSAYTAVVPDIVVDFIPPRWLSSLRAYNRLKVLPWLYERYAGYEFMLTHELDAFVFRDELLEWCREGWDYVGAPWFMGFNRCTPTSPPLAGGNSGFSLRRIPAALRVCGTLRYRRPAAEVIADWRSGRFGLRKTIHDLTKGNNFFGPLNDSHDNEDLFWSRVVPGRFPWFRVAPYEVARRFSFESNPRRLYAECGDRLPFGCHKWVDIDPDFWSGHLPAPEDGLVDRRQRA
jgi:hypothetical protein